MNPLSNLYEELTRQAGPRGFTFAGRVVQPGEPIQSVMQRVPVGELESGSLAQQYPMMQAMIAPATWRAMAPEAKAMMTNIANKYPDLFTQILKHPRDLTARVVSKFKKEPGTKHTQGGLYEDLGPTRGRLTVAEKYARDLPVPVHEVNHYLRAEHVASVHPVEALKHALTASHVLPPNRQGSLTHALNKLRHVQAQWGKPIGRSGIVLNPAEQRALESHITRFAYDEALAHLAEMTARPDASPDVLALARKLGVSVR